MADHKSARKRARQTPIRQERNKAVRTRLRTTLKQAREAVDGGADDAETRVRQAERELRRAASKGVIPAGRASRLVSRLSRRTQ
ncbi:MAG: 30S ribosomal protein S20 [Deltaproteobacteria bacterium]|nr:30S ribosomal protein S20 [Deltaproteobacteria bacterium]MBW2446949.1 30S ribosomal protein S20 [Deltaproteobacteria bacterium]